MAKVFISYSRKDIDFAKRLTAELQKSELDFWIDWEGIPPTVDWWKEIEKGIEESDAFLFLISPDSAKSKVCGQEIDHAVKNGKRLIPLIIRDTKGDKVHPKLSPLNWIFFREEDDFDASIQKLLKSIHTDFDWVETQRRLQVKALEWEGNNKEYSFLLRGKDLSDAELQLTINTSKNPYPTDLQREYVFESRKAADGQRRIVTSISISGVIALAALAVFGFYQAGQSANNAATAQANFIAAETAKVDAENKQILADNSAATAVANEQEALKQSQIALARQLAAQAQSINTIFNSKQMIATLLGIQSMKLSPTGNAANMLMNHNTGVPVRRISHEKRVSSVAINSDGSCVAISSGNVIYVWDIASGTEIAHFTHDDLVSVVIFSPDGKYIASGSNDNTARVWDIARGTEIAHLIHNNWVTNVVFSQDGLHVASVSGWDIYIWEATTGKVIFYKSELRRVIAVTFSLDGENIISGSEDGTVREWNASTGSEVEQKTYNIGFADTIALSPDGNFIAEQYWDGNIRLWENPTGNEVASMHHDDMVRDLAFSLDGKYLISGSSDGTARVWDTVTGIEVARMTHDDEVRAVATSPEGKYIVSGSLDGTVLVWEAAITTEVARISSDEKVTSVAYSPDGKFIVAGSGNGSVYVWETTTGNQVAHDLHGDDVTSVAFSPERNLVISGSQDGARVWKADTGDAIMHINVSSVGSGVTAVGFSPSGKYFVTGDDIGIAKVWEAATGNEIAYKTHNGNKVTAVAFSPDEKMVASSSWDKTVYVWQATTGNEITRIPHNESVNAVDFSPDGKHIVSGSGDGTVRIWRISDSTEVIRMAHDNFLYSVDFSPDGHYIVSGSEDNTARVWDAIIGKEIARKIHNGPVYSVSFSPDGKYIVSGSQDNIVRIWEWQPDDLIANACAVMPRNLSLVEWQQYVGFDIPYEVVCDPENYPNAIIPEDAQNYLNLQK